MAKRLKPGDILEAVAASGLLYLQYLGKHREYGDAVLVCPVEQGSRPSTYENLFTSGYVTFYPATVAVTRGLASVVGHGDPRDMPRRVRRPGARVGVVVKTWIVEDETGESVKHQLSEDERLLPIAAIWNHALLQERVREGWRPEMEGA